MSLVLFGSVTLYSIIIIAVFFFAYAIEKTIKFSGLMTFFKVFMGKNKGKILVRVYSKEGVIRPKVGVRKSNTVEFTLDSNQNKSNMCYFDSDGVYDYMGLKTVDYFEDDVNPRTWKNKNKLSVHPTVFDKTLDDSVKAEISSKQFDWKKIALYVGIAIAVIVGLLVFVILQQNETIIDLTTKLGGTNVITQNATGN